MRLTHTILSGLAFVFLALPSEADDGTGAAASPLSAAEQCLEDHGAAQKFERDGLLIESREKFIACSADVCPSAVRLECVHQTEKVGDKIPTAVLSLRTHEGAEVTDASVWLGGKKLADSLDGRAVPINPGRYDFEFRTADGAKTTVSAVLREGDDYREVSARLAPPAAVPAAADAAAVPRKNQTAAIVTWAVGGAALASFGTFAILGKVAEDCRPSCTDAEVDDIRLKYLVADISLAAAAAAGALGLTFYLTAPEVVDETESVSASEKRTVAVGLSGDGVRVWGTF